MISQDSVAAVTYRGYEPFFAFLAFHPAIASFDGGEPLVVV